MAEYRTLKMSMWSDPFIEELGPMEKLLYIFLITSPRTSNLGVLEISNKRISIETGIPVEQVRAGIETLKNAGKLVEIDGFLWLVNFIANQTSTSEKILKGLHALFQGLKSKKLQIRVYRQYPTIFKDCIDTDTLSNHIDTPSKGMDRVCIPCLEEEVELELELELEEEKELEVELEGENPLKSKPDFKFLIQKTLLDQNLLSQETFDVAADLLQLVDGQQAVESLNDLAQQAEDEEQLREYISELVESLREEEGKK